MEIFSKKKVNESTENSNKCEEITEHKINFIFNERNVLEQIVTINNEGSIEIYSPARDRITIELGDCDKVFSAFESKVYITVRKLPKELLGFVDFGHDS